MILTMAKYHENLLKDSPLSLLSVVKCFSSLETKMILKAPNETFLRITRYLFCLWCNISSWYSMISKETSFFSPCFVKCIYLHSSDRKLHNIDFWERTVRDALPEWILQQIQKWPNCTSKNCSFSYSVFHHHGKWKTPSNKLTKSMINPQSRQPTFLTKLELNEWIPTGHGIKN